MMTEDSYRWIDEHRDDDPARLRLKYGRDRADEILQIECRRRFGSKLAATLKDNPRFYFPTALSGEQSTGDALAAFHASLVNKGDVVVDLTAGLGIDAMAMARVASEVYAVERDPIIAEALRLNTRTCSNVNVVNADCVDFLKAEGDAGRTFDVVFIDPARRDDKGARTYALDDCSPDVVALQSTIAGVAPRLIVKASPMLDISHSLTLLPYTRRVLALGTSTECKELDFIIDFSAPAVSPMVSAVTILPSGAVSDFSFNIDEEAASAAVYGVPVAGQYILEPYPAVMKSGGFKLLAVRYGLSKLAPNSHVWFGDSIPDGFPGRAFLITEVLPYASRHIKRYAASHPRVGVTARNFDISADELRRKLGVTEGPDRLFAAADNRGERYLITTTDAR